MDTDFEDECKEIVQRRVKVTEKLKKIDKDSNQTANQSPSKMQVGKMGHLDITVPIILPTISPNCITASMGDLLTYFSHKCYH